MHVSAVLAGRELQCRCQMSHSILRSGCHLNQHLDSDQAHVYLLVCVSEYVCVCVSGCLYVKCVFCTVTQVVEVEMVSSSRGCLFC